MVYRPVVVTGATHGPWVALVLGLGVQAVTYMWAGELPQEVASLLGLAAGGLLVYGCSIIAKKKGYSSWLGLMGLFSAVGVLILLLLPPVEGFPRVWRRSVLPERGADGAKPRPGEPSP